MFLRKTAQFPDISTVAPSTDFFEISVFLKHMHQEFMYHRNFGWKLKSNLLPLLVQCVQFIVRDGRMVQTGHLYGSIFSGPLPTRYPDHVQTRPPLSKSR